MEEKDLQVDIPAEEKEKKRRNTLKAFFMGDLKDVGDYLVHDVILPNARRSFLDICNSGLEMLTYGELRSSPRSSSGNSTSKIAYNVISNNRASSNSKRVSGSYSSLIFTTRRKADEALGQLRGIIAQYQFCSINDVYELASEEWFPDKIWPNDYTAEDYGWCDLSSDALIINCRDGYWLKLPRPRPRPE